MRGWVVDMEGKSGCGGGQEGRRALKERAPQNNSDKGSPVVLTLFSLSLSLCSDHP
jgi:hypothetical protein